MTILLPSMHEFRYQEAIKPRLERALARAGAAGDFYVDRGANDNAADFMIKTQNGQDAFVVEVKKTHQDTSSHVCWGQARRYAMDSTNWASGIPRFFSITNGEELNVFCLRTGYTHINYSLLNGGMYEIGHYGPHGEADNVLQQLEDRYTALFEDLLVNRNAVQYDDYWFPILDSFDSQVEHAVAAEDTNMESPSEPGRSLESTVSEAVFKALGYEILRITLSSVPLSQLNHVRLRPLNTSIRNGVVDADSLTDLYNDILQIDFRSLFGEVSADSYLIRMQSTLHDMPAFLGQLQAMSNARSEIANTDFLVSSIIDTTIPDSLKHDLGLAIEDSSLANVLSQWCVQSATDQVVDVAAGTGTLLGSSYDRLAQMARNAHQGVSHSVLVSNLAGIEKDAFVASIGTLRMILKDPVHETGQFIDVQDAFSTHPTASYDALICNPPYRRSTELDPAYKGFIQTCLRNAYGIADDDSSFPLPREQADLYMYFVEWGMLFVRPAGRAGWILSDKFLSTKSGRFLKQFLLERCVLDAIVRYPGRHFCSDFDVTTCFALVHATAPGEAPSPHEVRFLRLHEGTDIDSIPEWLEMPQTVDNSEGILRVVSSNDMTSDRNWRQYFMTVPKDYDRWIDQDHMSPLRDVFRNRCRRGSDNGCKSFFFPYTNLPMKIGRGEDPHDYRVRKALNETNARAWLADIRRAGFLKSALNNSWRLQSYYLDGNTQEKESALVIPANTNLEATPSLSEFIRLAGSGYSDCHGLGRSSLDGDPKPIPERTTVSRFGHHWYSFYSTVSTCKEGLVFPRMPRDIFKVLIPRIPYYFSTNFFLFDAPTQDVTGMPELEFTECAAAFLMSSLGQLQCEYRGDWREGLLKLEGDAIYGIKVLDPVALTADQRQELIAAFRNLPFGLTGLELPGTGNPRLPLDTVVMSLLGVTCTDPECVTKLETALRENVKDRKESPSD
jgi:hypothetical protein